MPGDPGDPTPPPTTARAAAALCDWLGMPATAVVTPLPPPDEDGDDLPPVVARTGPGRLAHIVFEHPPAPGLAARMLQDLCWLSVRDASREVDQRVVVLGGGTAAAELCPDWASYQAGVTYLRDQEPGPLLANPALAPFAALARTGDRAAVLRQALVVIAAEPDPANRRRLACSAGLLAGLYLDPATITDLMREAGMPFTLDEDTVAGRVLAARHFSRGEARGLLRGETRGLARGLARERVAMLSTLLHRTFGNDPRIDEAAHALAALPRAEAIERALTATSLDDVQTC